MDIFISYSSKEYEKACMISKVLNDNGITTWMAPGSIPAGSNYTREIPKAIRECKVFLLLLSAHAQDSLWVSAELENAFKNEKPIIPFVIEHCILKDEFDFLLSRCQRIEAYEKSADALERLVLRLKALVGTHVSTQTPPVFQSSPIFHTSPTTPNQGRPAVAETPVGGKFETIHYDNGDVYEGITVDGKRTGKGKYTWADGDVYEGDFVDDKRTGKGRYVWKSGNVYEGDFVDGKCHGKGKRIWADGDVYEGDFVDDKRTGKGRYVWKSGKVYEGDFVDGKCHGKGKRTWVGGDVYVGDFATDKRSGKGKYTWADGEDYEGDFVDSKRTRQGSYSWKSGNSYQGDFVDGKRTGKGKFVWADGDVYEGDFVANERSGRGTYTCKNGTVYTGEFLNGKYHGQGTLRTKESPYGAVVSVKEGRWVEGALFDGTERRENGTLVAKYVRGNRK